MKLATFLWQSVVFCCTFLFLFCLTQLGGCGYPSYNLQQNTHSVPNNPQKTVSTNNATVSQETKVSSTKNSRVYKSKSYVVRGKKYHVLNTKNATNYQKIGTASWYGKKFHGRLTSSRERFNLYGMTAASPVLPLLCYVRVTNLNNGKQVVVKVNDRGPFCRNRIIDLSYAAAKKLGFSYQGLARVKVETIDPIADGQKKYPMLVANDLYRKT